jgi:hypothetical protein
MQWSELDLEDPEARPTTFCPTLPKRRPASRRCTNELLQERSRPPGISVPTACAVFKGHEAFQPGPGRQEL